MAGRAVGVLELHFLGRSLGSTSCCGRGLLPDRRVVRPVGSLLVAATVFYGDASGLCGTPAHLSLIGNLAGIFFSLDANAIVRPPVDVNLIGQVPALLLSDR